MADRTQNRVKPTETELKEKLVLKSTFYFMIEELKISSNWRAF